MAFFVIDANNEIIRFSGAETAPYLEPFSGPPSFNLFAILRKDLRQPVRVAVQQARAKGKGGQQTRKPLSLQRLALAESVLL